jgi:hypothetical protein
MSRHDMFWLLVMIGSCSLALIAATGGNFDLTLIGGTLMAAAVFELGVKP